MKGSVIVNRRSTNKHVNNAVSPFQFKAGVA